MTINKLVAGAKGASGNSTGKDIADAVNGLIEYTGQPAKHSPTVMIDFTDPNTPLPPAVQGSATTHEFGICPYNGKRGLHVVVAPNTGFSIGLPSLAGLEFHNQAYITVFDNNLSFGQNIQFRAYSTASEFWGMQNLLASSQNNGDRTGGSQIRTFNTSHRVAQGSPSSADSFSLVDARIVFPSQANGYDMWIFNVGFGQPRKGRICITWDDGRMSSLTLGVPVFNALGIKKQTLGLIQNRVGLNANSVTLGQCKAFINAGGSIVPHSPHSPNIVDQFPGDPAGAVAAIVQNINYIKTLGLATPRFDKCFIYPQGKYQESAFDTSYIEAMRSIGIDIARISFMQQIRQQRNLDSHSRLGRLACTTIGHEYSSTDEAANIAAVIQRISEVSDLGLDCFLMLHSVVPANGQETDPYDISVPNLKLIAQAIKTNIDVGKLEAVTMPELVIDGDNYWNQF